MEIGIVMTRPRLVLADDHTLMFHGMSRILEPHFDIVGHAKDGRTLVSLAEKLHPDLILLDISMPLLNGIDATRLIRKLLPGVRIVFLTMHADRDYIIEAFRAGASGYLLKSSAEEELVTALRTVLRGETYVTHDLPEELRAIPLKRSSLGVRGEAGLTCREREVLQLVAEGRSAKETAGILFLSAKTVEYHKYKMMKKLGVHTVAELTAYALQKKLLGLAPPVHEAGSQHLAKKP